MSDPALAAVPDGVLLQVQVQPRAARAEVVGRHGDTVRIRLQAPPVDGAANEALLRFLADRLAIPARKLELVKGHGTRAKVVLVRGASPPQIAMALGLAPAPAAP